MVDLLKLVEDTSAFKIVSGDIKAGRLSHAYLLITSDGDNLLGYLKEFAKLMLCETHKPCGFCRTCYLIDDESYPDAIFLPKEKDSVTVEDVSALIEESFIKPIESDKKLFVINHAEKMNATSQNKLLKTLEEPPANVHILIGATTDVPLLSTLKSRVKRLEIPPFSDDKLIDALNDDCTDLRRLMTAVANSDGTVGNALSLYGDETLSQTTDMVLDMLVNMQSSRDVLEYSVKISGLQAGFDGFLSSLETALMDLLYGLEGKINLIRNKSLYNQTKLAKGYNRGAVLYALDKISEANRRKNSNANITMLTEWLLFQILEGKYKWQKS